MTLARFRDGKIEIMTRLKDPARLAASLDRHGYMSQYGMNRGIGTLTRFHDLAKVQGAEMRASGTAALRAARNADVFVQRAADEAGVQVDLITGNQEARLTFQGVQHGMPELAGKRLFCVDVGGGSTELACGTEHAEITASIAVGSLVVGRKNLGADPVKRKTVRRTQAMLIKRLRPHTEPIARSGFEVAVATSGTIQRVVRIGRALEGLDKGTRAVHGLIMPAAQLKAAIERMTAAPTHAERLCISAMDPERADTLLPGALIFQALTELLEIKSWTVSMAALRTGLIIDTYARRAIREGPLS